MDLLFSIVVLGAPIWIPAVLLLFSPRVAIGLFLLALLACAGALSFSLRHASDRDPWQWPSALISLGALWLAFCLGLGVVVTQVARMRVNRRRSSAVPESRTKRTDDAELDVWIPR